MTQEEFEKIAGEEFSAVPERFKKRLQNVALLIEEEGDGTLLGLYHGVPATERGEGYGNLGTLPDTITLFYKPLLQEAAELLARREAATFPQAVRRAIRETLWHEIGHQLGMSEEGVHEREEGRTNRFEG